MAEYMNTLEISRHQLEGKQAGLVITSTSLISKPCIWMCFFFFCSLTLPVWLATSGQSQKMSGKITREELEEMREVFNKIGRKYSIFSFFLILKFRSHNFYILNYANKLLILKGFFCISRSRQRWIYRWFWTQWTS